MAIPASNSHHELPSCTQVLLRHLRERPEQRAFTFLAADGGEASHLTFRQLLFQAAAVAERLAELGLRGERVMLFHPPGAAFIVAFYGCLLAGAVAVPLPPPLTRRLQERAQTVVDDCRALAILTTPDGFSAAQEIAAGRAGMRILDTEELAPTETVPDTGMTPDTLAFLQYTSGSTGTPKGVMVTHGNLRANTQQIAIAFGVKPGDVCVSWLPLHHDMGLIGCTVSTIHHGLHCVQMPPQSMVAKPIRWLQAVHRYRATISGGPDFAWRLVADRVEAAALHGLDLSCWRVAFCGAEPVRLSTLERAADHLSGTGFTTAAFLPCYGLAEATLLVSGDPERDGPHCAVPEDTRALEPSSPTYVGCGHPVPHDAVSIVDPESCTALAERRVGEVWIHGPHVAAGYWGRETDSEQTFRAKMAGDARCWLRTGDLGFLADGRVFITGRIKDLLILNGKKYHAEDVEATVRTVAPECGMGASAAFQVEQGDNPRLVIAFESGTRMDPHAQEELRRRISAIVWEHHGILVDEVTILRLGRLPRTTSGKVRRSEARRMHAEGMLAGSRPSVYRQRDDPLP